MKEIFNRRSIRKFQDRPVEKEKILKLLHAAMQAPSSANQQPWEFLVVENKDTLKALSNTSPYAKPAEHCGVALVLMGNSDYFKAPGGWVQDLSAAAQNILLEAVHLELGAVWLGVARAEERVDYLRRLFGLPENILPFAILAVGYPDGQKNEFMDRFKEERVHYEKF